MIVAAALVFVQLTGPDGQAIFVNPADIVAMRAPREAAQEHLSPGVQCVLQTTDGKVIYVIEGCDVVLDRLKHW